MELSEVSVRQLGVAVDEARELLIFLGAGSSAEGYQDDGRFPDFGALIRRVLEDEGIDGGGDQMAAFLGVMRRWEQDAMLSVRLSSYLHGTPGIPHYQMASMSMSLFPHVNMTVYLTTNYDDLMLKALAAVSKADPRRDPRSFSLGRNAGVAEISRTFDAIRAHAAKGVPVLVKLFGDLTANSPIFEPGDMPFDEWTEQRLSLLFDRPLLFIGCSLRDAPILRLLVRSRSMHPVFVVSPDAPDRNLLPRLAQRRFCWVPASFSSFVSEFLHMRRAASSTFSAEFARFLSVADAAVFLESHQALQDLATAASATAVARFRSRSGSPGSDAPPVPPIKRPDTGPDFARFARSSDRILAVVGESGSGKSTLLNEYYTQTRERGEDVCFYYDAQTLQTGKSLSDTLALDLMVERVRLPGALLAISSRLADHDRNLIIVIDAINESIAVEPNAIRHEIEALARTTPANMRFVYSCRRVVWEDRIAPTNDLPRELYDGHKPFLLGRFSPREASEAYEAHRTSYGLRSSYDSLSWAVREHVRDPLMLRLVAEAYRDLRLPTFAPASLVFRLLMDRLRAKYRRTPLIDYLERLVDLRLRGFDAGDAAGDVFTYNEAWMEPGLALLAQQQLGAGKTAEHPLTVLEDENVIACLDPSEKHFKFTYERFYEFLLGLRFHYRLFARSHTPFESALIPLLSRCRESHYSFYQGMRSAFVAEFLNTADGSQRRSIADLIFHPMPDVAAFACDVLREAVFESGDDALAMLSTLTGTKRGGLTTLLDLGYEVEGVAPFAVAALFEDDAALRRKSVACLIGHERLYGSRDHLLELLERALMDEAINAQAKATAVVYFAAVLAGAGSDTQTGVLDAVQLLRGSMGAATRDVPHAELARALAVSLVIEGPLFFGANYRGAGVIATWRDRGTPIQERAGAVVRLLRDPSPETLSASFDAILFLSQIELQPGPDGPELEARQIDYRVVQWLLVRMWRSHPTSVLDFLDGMVASGLPFAPDFALGVVEQALVETPAAPKAVVDASLARMTQWTRQYEAAPEFYVALDTRDPFTFNLAPLAMLAHVQARFSTTLGAIPVLTEWLSDKEKRRRQMAVLAANWLARSCPEKVLSTLEGFLDDAETCSWIDRVLAGYSAFAPRALEDFFDRARVPMRRREAIRRLNHSETGAVVQFRPDAVLAWLFLGPQARLDRVASIYALMYRSSTVESFFLSLLDPIEAAAVAIENSQNASAG